eukprot:2071436-Prymnesium_polylepis.1
MRLTMGKSESALTALQVLKERLPEQSDITRIGQQIHERSAAPDVSNLSALHCESPRTPPLR